MSLRGLCVTCRRKRFVRLTKDSAFYYLGGNECHLLGTDQDLLPMCKTFVKNYCVVMLPLVLYHVLKSTEPLSFESPVETDVIRRSLIFIYIFIIRGFTSILDPDLIS